MLNEEYGSELTDINKWAGDKLDILLECGISYMMIKEG